MANVLGQVSVPDLLNQISIVIPAITAANMALVAAIKGIFKITSPAVNHWISYILSVLIGLGFYFFNGLDFGLGTAGNIICCCLTGLISGCCSNSVYDWDSIKSVIDLITKLFWKKA